MTAELARAGGAVGALGLAALMLGHTRGWRLGGLVAWALGCAALALWLAPAGHHRLLAAAAVLGAVASVAVAWLFVRVPWLLPVAILACAPARIPVSVGSTKANLLLPMYLVVAAAALALAWELVRRDLRARELGLFALPVGLFVAWSGVCFLWSQDRREGAIYLLFYLLPLGLLAVSLSRLPWRTGWVQTLYVQLAGMALAFAAVGCVQYLTRTVYWNPKVKVDNAYAPSSWFYRVNSVFYDPSIYGRFLVVGILASLVAVLYGSRRIAWAALLVAAATWIGLVPSFSQSSFVALGAGVVAAVIVLWGRRAVLPVAIVVVVAGVVALGVPQTRHRLLGKGGFSHATGGRSKLVSNGVRLAVHHPVIGVGTGGFRRAYANLTHLRGKQPKAAASHDTPITVAAENGVPGLALLAWLLAVAIAVPLRLAVRGRTAALRTASLAFGLALLAIAVHSLFYDALFEDPLFWGALALSAVAARGAAA